MSKVQIEISDDRWFRGEWQFRPQDKQLCIVIFKEGSKIPKIFQYRKDLDFDLCFLDIENCIDYFEYEIAPDASECYDVWECVDLWKPLGLPADVNERVLAEIEKWFGEDSD